jgi:NCS1 family nucleobase:cation symporter-1
MASSSSPAASTSAHSLCNFKFFLAMWPALPGFVNAMGGIEVDILWRRFYQISFFFGYLVAGGLYWIFCTVSRPRGVGIRVNLDVDGRVLVMENVNGDVESKVPSSVEKQAETVETKAY